MTRLRWLRSFALVLFVTTLLRAATLFIPIFNPDEAYLATQAHVLTHGGRLYLDTADRKPPIVPLLYAATFHVVGADSLIAVHVLVILLVAATALVIEALARGHGAERFAAWFFLLASTVMLPTDALGANFELFMLLPGCAAVLCATRRQDMLAGLLLALAMLCKQTAAVNALPIVLVIGLSARRLASFGVGALATLGLACAIFGARELYEWTLAGIPGYLSTGTALRAALLHSAFVTAMMLLVHAPLVWLVWRARTAQRTAVLWSWLLVSAIAVCTGLRFFGHYYLQLLPPAAILGAIAVDVTHGRRLVGLMALAAVVASTAGFFGPRIHEQPHFEALSAYVRAHTQPDERIAIWGNYPEVYFGSERSPATRIVHTDFLTGVSGGRTDDYAQTESDFSRRAWREYFEDLERNEPRLFIDASVRGLRHYEHQPISRYPDLERWLHERYDLAATIDGLPVYARRNARARDGVLAVSVQPDQTHLAN